MSAGTALNPAMFGRSLEAERPPRRYSVNPPRS